MSNMRAFAESELKLLRDGGPDEMQDMIEASILEVVDVFSAQGHSGSSASYALACLKKLLAFEPLTPLHGRDDEWMTISEDVMGRPAVEQNRRCSHVFREAGEAYDIEGRIFREPDGACFTSRDSRVPVTFPYTPKREYVDVPA